MYPARIENMKPGNLLIINDEGEFVPSVNPDPMVGGLHEEWISAPDLGCVIRGTDIKDAFEKAIKQIESPSLVKLRASDIREISGESISPGTEELVFDGIPLCVISNSEIPEIRGK